MSSKPIKSVLLTRFRLDKINGGAPLRTWQNVQCLARLGPVDIVSIGAEAPEKKVEGVRNYLTIERPEKKAQSLAKQGVFKKLYTLLFKGHPMLESLYFPAAVEKINRELDDDYDVAVLEELWLMCYLPTFKQKTKFTVFDAHNVENVLHANLDGPEKKSQQGLASRVRSKLMHRHLLKAEQTATQQSDFVWVCSEVDRQAFLEFPRSAQPDVIPNSIDVKNYGATKTRPIGSDWSDLPVTLMYLGMYSYFPNEQAALILIKEVMPILRKKGISVQLNLVGKGPTQSMKDAAAGADDILITGMVDSIQPYLESPSIIAIPLRLGSGTRLKIVESFASRCPVVSSAKGVEGINGVDEEHLLIRETAEEFAEAILELWNDAPKRQKLVENARRLAEESYSFESAGELIQSSLKRKISF